MNIYTSIIEQFYERKTAYPLTEIIITTDQIRDQVIEIIRNKLSIFNFSHDHTLSPITRFFRFRASCNIELTGLEVSTLSEVSLGILISLPNGIIIPLSCENGYEFFDLKEFKSSEELTVIEGETFEVAVTPERPIKMLEGKVFALNL